MLRAAREAVDGDAAVVAVAYADAARVPSRPLPPRSWSRRRGRRASSGCLLDTAVKDGRGLLSWLAADALAALVAEAHDAGLEMALAGELRAEDLPAVRATGADIAGVRSAACRDGRRTAALDPARIARLRALCARRGAARADLTAATAGARHERPGRAALVEQLGEPRRLAAVDHPRLDAGGAQRRGQVRVDPAGRSAASSSTRQPRDRLAGRRPGAVEARDRLDEHEPPGARGAGHPRGDRVRGDRPRRGQRVALRQQRGRAAGRRRRRRAPARARSSAPRPGSGRRAPSRTGPSPGSPSGARSAAAGRSGGRARGRRPRTPRRRARRAADGARPPPRSPRTAPAARRRRPPARARRRP